MVVLQSIWLVVLVRQKSFSAYTNMIQLPSNTRW